MTLEQAALATAPETSLDQTEVVGPSAAALVLRFGAVNYHARVWVNGSLAVEHEGGYLPFEAEIGALVRPGRNEVAVAVTAPTDDRELYPDFPVGEVPFGKQSWYGP